MEAFPFPTTAAVIGQRLGARVVGHDSAPVSSLDALPEAHEGSLTYLSNRRFESFLGRIRGAVVFVQPELVRPELPLTYILVADPQRAFAEVARQFTPLTPWVGVSPQASVHASARLEEGVAVAPFAVICEGARIGARTVIYPHAYVGREVEIGCDSHIHPQVTLLDRVRIGSRVKIFPGSVLGSDGFGLLAQSGGGHAEMPQIGTVVVEDDVRIGAKCTIDRATIGQTHIGRGAKIDDQVHIGHNCRVGAHSVLCAQVGLSGSTVLEEGVVLAGQVGIADGITIGKGARVGAQSGVGQSLSGGKDYFGSPAIPTREAMRLVKYFRKLPEFWQRLKALEERLEGKHG